MADSPLGPFKRIGKVILPDPAIANGAGHHLIFNPPNGDCYIAYHRRPAGVTEPNHREVCIERMGFDAQGLIQPVPITREGVAARPIGGQGATR